MSHTAALSNDDEIIDAAFERAGIIRISQFNDFISVAKAFDLPPMRGNRLMMMSPAGGITVMMADLCEKIGFRFADPGKEFYEGLKGFSNAGVIKFSNPLDMGDIYDPQLYAQDLLRGDAQRQRRRRGFRQPVAPDAPGRGRVLQDVPHRPFQGSHRHHALVGQAPGRLHLRPFGDDIAP